MVFFSLNETKKLFYSFRLFKMYEYKYKYFLLQGILIIMIWNRIQFKNLFGNAGPRSVYNEYGSASLVSIHGNVQIYRAT
jgi:hypothetical protein